jgi:hypothetical protein
MPVRKRKQGRYWGEKADGRRMGEEWERSKNPETEASEERDRRKYLGSDDSEERKTNRVAT